MSESKRKGYQLEEDEKIAIITLFLLLILGIGFIWWKLQGNSADIDSAISEETVAQIDQMELPETGIILDVQADKNDRLLVTGKTIPSEDVQIYINDTNVGTTSADNAGNWSFTSPKLETGEYDIFARIQPEGNRTAQDSDHISVAIASAGVVAIANNAKDTEITATDIPIKKEVDISSSEIVTDTETTEEGTTIQPTAEVVSDTATTAPVVVEEEPTPTLLSRPIVTETVIITETVVSIPATAVITPTEEVKEVITTKPIVSDPTAVIVVVTETVVAEVESTETITETENEQGEEEENDTITPESTFVTTSETPKFITGTNGIIQEPGSYTVRGTSVANSRILYELINDSNSSTKVVTVSDAGTWHSIMDFTTLGIHTLKAVSVDEAALPTSFNALARIYIVPDLSYPAPSIDDSGVPTFKGSDLTVVGAGNAGTILKVQVNGAPFGEAIVEDNGRWIVNGTISPNLYEIRAFTYEEGNDTILAVSKPVYLNVK